MQYLLLLVEHFCIINRVLDNYDWEMVLYGGQFSSKLQLQRIAFQKVWCEEMTEEQIMNSTLMSRTAIIGVRNIYDYPDTLLEMNDLFKRRL